MHLDKRKLGTATHSQEREPNPKTDWFAEDAERRKAFNAGVEAAKAAFGSSPSGSGKKEPIKK